MQYTETISAEKKKKKNHWIYFDIYSPALKKWGYTGFTLSFRRSVLPLFRHSVHNSVTTYNLRISC